MTSAKYMRVIEGFSRRNDNDSEENMPVGVGIAYDTDTGFLGSPNLREFVVKGDYVTPIGGSVGAVDTAVPGIIKISKTYVVNKRISWDITK